MTPAQRPNTIIASEEGELLNILGAPMAVRLADPAASLFVARHTTPPGFMVPPHKHEDDDEAFYILEGTLTLLGADGETTATAGDFAFLPRGSVHGFRNDTKSDVEFLVICTPGVQSAEMFRQLDRVANGAPLSPETTAAVTSQYGVEFC